jgi:site-specific DNA recombinase
MKAIGYFRESGQSGGSLAEQNKAFLEYCGQQGLEVAGTFADGPSSNGHAPGFREMVTHVRSDRTGLVVVVSSVQALGHDLRDAAVRVFQLEGLGVRVTPMSGGADAEAALMAAWTSDTANDRLSDKVRAAMRKKAVKGEVLGRPPFGYKVGARRRLELVPDEALVVRYIYRLYLQEGLGIRLIARRLNEENIKTRRGGNWSMVSIRDILRNRAYLGTYARFNVRVSGSHPSLVAVDDFKRVQERLNARRTSYAPRVTSQFLLSGIAQCGYCHNTLIGVSRKQTWKRRSGEKVSNSYRYYQCESRTNQSLCGYHTRRADELEECVRAELALRLADGKSPVAVDAPAAAAEQAAEVEKLRARLRSLDRRLESCIDTAARGRISKQQMHERSLAVAGDRLATEDAIDAAERRLATGVSPAARSRSRDEHMRSLNDTWDGLSFDERQAVIRDAILRIEVLDDGLTLTIRP